MSRPIYFITHPDVVIDPLIPVPQWPLSERGKSRIRRLLSHAWIARIEALYCSTEQKAVDGAALLSEALGIPFHQVAALGKTTVQPLGTSPRQRLKPRSTPSLPGHTRAFVGGSAPSTPKPVS